MRPKVYKCENCGKEFTKGWTDEEALSEKDELFPDTPIEDCAFVCDVCFKKIIDFAGIHHVK